MVVRQVVPCVAARAVILADRTPLPLAHIRSPQIPGAGLVQSLLEPPEPVDSLAFSTHRRSLLPCPGPGKAAAISPRARTAPTASRIYGASETRNALADQKPPSPLPLMHAIGHGRSGLRRRSRPCTGCSSRSSVMDWGGWRCLSGAPYDTLLGETPSTRRSGTRWAALAITWRRCQARPAGHWRP